ncbi:YrrS family protein [uncultured Trichococcus sp.]|uniref:YrrS family protein n=1 Tax=uncultured Trichococcus sp. TaxID=189665 RepID=UPI0029C8F86A|nr:YrrS family protein [uncultured Trichococcus sp.]
MSENNQKPTRQELHGNHKRNNLLVVLGVIAAAFLGLVLLYNIFYGNDEEPSVAADNQTNSQNMIITESDDSSKKSSSAEESSEKEKKEEKDTETETEEVPSTDENVTKAYTGDWEPTGTTQTGEHTTTDFSDGSADRNEIKQAVAAATGISADNMIEWWIGNAGAQQVTATVSDTQKETIARVQLKWVDGEGWQVMLVEELDEIPNN